MWRNRSLTNDALRKWHTTNIEPQSVFHLKKNPPNSTRWLTRPTQKTIVKTISSPQTHTYIHIYRQRRPLLQQSFRQWFMRRPSSITGRMLDPDLYTRVCSPPPRPTPELDREMQGNREARGMETGVWNSIWRMRIESSAATIRKASLMQHYTSGDCQSVVRAQIDQGKGGEGGKSEWLFWKQKNTDERRFHG